MNRVLMIFICLFFFGATNVLANCSVSVNPGNVLMGAASVSTFTISNNSDQVGNWVRIQSPGLSAYSIAHMEASGWYPNGGGTEANFAGGYLESGASANFALSLAETGEEISSMSWEALISYDGGENFASCGGINILVERAETPQISNATITVGNNSAVLTWNSSVTATGSVNFGVSESYGSSVSSGTGVTHVATLSNLSPSTTYNYQIRVTSEGGTTTTTNNTFVTSAADVVTTVTNTVTSTVTNTVVNTVTQTNTNTVIVGDTTPPVVTVKALEKEIWANAPVIEGSAIDNRGVARVEYRISGANWVSSSLKNEVGSKRVEWEALPEVTLDGSYEVEVRAVDIFGNRGHAKKIKVVIDNLPPTVGGAVFFANEVALPAKNGVVNILEKQPIRVQFKELGGAERVVVVTNGKTHVAVKDKSTSIWNLEITLDSGVYESKMVAVDGAGKKVEKNWVTFEVAPRGKVLIEGKEITDFEVTVWKKDSFGKFRKGETKKVLGWLLPSGQYYLSLQVNGRKYLSQVVDIVEPRALTGVWNLGAPKWWNRLLPAGKPIDLFVSVAKGKENFMNSTLIPNKWYGTKKIVYVTTPDLPYAVEGLTIAKQEAEKIGSNLVVVGLQASKQEMEMWMAGKNIDYMDDWEGKWLSESSLLVLPTKYYLDTFGKVVNIKEGVY